MRGQQVDVARKIAGAMRDNRTRLAGGVLADLDRARLDDEHRRVALAAFEQVLAVGKRDEFADLSHAAHLFVAKLRKRGTCRWAVEHGKSSFCEI